MRFQKFYPKKYVKSIYDIDYQKLKENKIKCLIFDLDNTIALIDQEKLNQETIALFQKLKKDFIVVILSNNTKKRVADYAKQLDCDYVSFARKPFLFGYRKIQKKYAFTKGEMVMIGDQLVTDIFAGNKFEIDTILVDPMAYKDLKITTFNRMIEARILKYFEKQGIMKKGEYYHE